MPDVVELNHYWDMVDLDSIPATEAPFSPNNCPGSWRTSNFNGDVATSVLMLSEPLP